MSRITIGPAHGYPDEEDPEAYAFHFRTERGAFEPGEWFAPQRDAVLERGKYAAGAVTPGYGSSLELARHGMVTGAYVEFADAPTVESGGVSYVDIGNRRYNSLAELQADYKVLTPDGYFHECYGDGECGDGAICMDGECASGCQHDVDCPPDQMCWDTACVDCINDVHCPDGHSCAGGTCRSDTAMLANAPADLTREQWALALAAGGAAVYWFYVR